jgi:cation:H+ antiporter
MSTGAVFAIFVAGALVTFFAGTNLAKATDVLDERYGLGEAIGGMILLSIAGGLPELAITVSAAVSGHLSIAAGNLIGGIAMQTFVLVIADMSVRGKRPLSTSASSLIPALEGALVITVVTITVASAVLPATAAIGSVSVGSIGIVVAWIAGMFVLNGTRKRSDLALPDRDLIAAESGGVPSSATSRASSDAPPADSMAAASMSGPHAIGLFAVASAITLVAGVVLEKSGNQLAIDWNMNGVLFGATFLAAATALPEISSGITGARLGRPTLVFGDMFGGNAFQVTLFLLADILAGQPVLPSEGKSNAWIGCVGIVMTAIYVWGIILRPRKRYARLGPDSWIVTVVYILGLWGLVVISS